MHAVSDWHRADRNRAGAVRGIVTRQVRNGKQLDSGVRASIGILQRATTFEWPVTVLVYLRRMAF